MKKVVLVLTGIFGFMLLPGQYSGTSAQVIGETIEGDDSNICRCRDENVCVGSNPISLRPLCDCSDLEESDDNKC